MIGLLVPMGIWFAPAHAAVLSLRLIQPDHHNKENPR
jgi:hypothetical protein